jgi:bifunctional enzyme CysN/CysC
LENDSEAAASTLQVNDIGLCDFTTNTPFLCDPYHVSPVTGGFLIVDEISNETIGAGMVRHSLRRSANITPVSAAIEQATRTARFGHKPLVLWFTGLSGSGKSTIAKLTEKALWGQGISTAMLDGDNLRTGLCQDLGFTEGDRVENIRRTAEAAKLLTQSGMVVICALISPSQRDRDMARAIIGKDHFVEIFVDAPLDSCIARDPKGLYAKALRGEIPNFTGIGSPYDAPRSPDLHLHTDQSSATELAALARDLALSLVKTG